jgi:Helix-turn-helix domain
LEELNEISSRFFTLDEATNWLGLKSEKTIRRWITSKKIRAEKRKAQRKKRWVIKGSELIPYKLQKDGWFHRTFSPIPPIKGYGKHLGFSFTFGAWGVPAEGVVQVSPRAFLINDPDRIPTFELKVSLDDLCRFVRTTERIEKQRPQSKREYEKLKNELRSRLRNAPENFKVRFRLDKSTLSTLERIVKSVKPPRLSDATAQELQNDAVTHVLYRVLPDLWRAKKDWTHYAKRAVKNFYRDRVRQDKNPINRLNSLVDVDRLAELSNISDPWEYSIASGESARARKKVKPAH